MIKYYNINSRILVAHVIWAHLRYVYFLAAFLNIDC